VKELLRDPRVLRLLVANTLGSIGSGVTIFAVPWLMVHRENGSAVYRWSTIGTTVVLFLIMPHYGAWVDRSSRKTMLLASEAFGFLATAAMALAAIVLGAVDTWQLVVSYFCGMLYYTLHYPAKFAFIQQIFDRSQYQSLVGLLEIQGQTAMMIAGGLGGFLVDRGVPLWAILAFDAATYAISYGLMSTLPYRATHLETLAGSTAAAAPSVWRSVAQGWSWLKAHQQLNLFFSCTLVPFIVVMASNYLFPIYVSQVLTADAKVFGAGEITFAFGAVIAGAWLPRLIARHSAYHTINTTLATFVAGLLILIFVPKVPLYLLAGIFLGFGNAGCRVARSALMLHLVPNEVMGRVNIFYQVFDRVVRTALVAALQIIDYYGARSGFVLLLGVLLLAYWGVLRSRHSIRKTEEGEATAPAAAT
jgi:MFS family permease